MNEWGFFGFITFAELMDPSKGFYNKNEDKVTLAIDFTMENEKEDIWVMYSEGPNVTLLFEIENLSEFAREVFGSWRCNNFVTKIEGHPWKIVAKINPTTEGTDAEKCLGFYLWCAAPQEGPKLTNWRKSNLRNFDKKWTYKCLATFRIISQGDLYDMNTKLDEQISEKIESNYWGFDNFISFTELVDPSKGFYDKDEDKVTLAVDFTMENASFGNGGFDRQK
ncbi:hypothetical protein niasHS_016378 [Heterodera schachtii]|uniref:MATH domain-containing protein n=1 Tax=Heterodera schachtii TaxID=97005 RepID=A0ABD2IES9_HETSC